MWYIIVFVVVLFYCIFFIICYICLFYLLILVLFLSLMWGLRIFFKKGVLLSWLIELVRFFFIFEKIWIVLVVFRVFIVVLFLVIIGWIIKGLYGIFFLLYLCLLVCKVKILFRNCFSIEKCLFVNIVCCNKKIIL